PRADGGGYLRSGAGRGPSTAGTASRPGDAVLLPDPDLHPPGRVRADAPGPEEGAKGPRRKRPPSSVDSPISRRSTSSPRRRSSPTGPRSELGLSVEPRSSRARVTEALAPHADRLPGVRDGDLTIVAVELLEPGSRLVAGTR